VFLTNDFDDPLEGFDTSRYVPCLRTDELVFHLDKPAVRERLAKATNQDVQHLPGIRKALVRLFEHFMRKGAIACALSLPPESAPRPVPNPEYDTLSLAVFWSLAENCREFKLPFDLMIGVNRRVYENGVHQGQDLFDQRTSLIQYAPL